MCSSDLTSAALSIEKGDLVFEGPENDILGELHAALDYLEPGLIVTWNGAVFDFPYIDSRMGQAGWLAADRPRLRLQRGLKPKYEPTPGYDGVYAVTWGKQDAPHTHLDVSFAYKQRAADLGVSHSLKPVCAAMGIPMVELDRTRLRSEEHTSELQSH